MVFIKGNPLKRFGLLFIILASILFQACGKKDKEIAVIGRFQIKQSDLESELAQAKLTDPNFKDSMICLILQQMIIRTMLVGQAEHDKISVTDSEVTAQLENRLAYLKQLYGSTENLEKAAGKPIPKIKAEYRDAIREQLLVEKMQENILDSINISPSEVEQFYKKIPEDSLPFFPSAVELGQIVIDPTANKEMDDYARAKLEGIRNDIVKNGKSFEILAGVYSDDPGSKDNGGRYDGITRSGPWAPEFIAEAFKLQDGEISPVFKTKFGYHIIQMIHRKGDEADLRHILIRPDLTAADFQKSLQTLDSIRKLLVSGQMTFLQAVNLFSTDEATKTTAGMLTDPTTGNTELDAAKLEPKMVLLLDSLKPGDYSKPQIFITDGQQKSCRIVYLKNMSPPHKASLKEDYGKIQQVALAQKKNEKIMEWVNGKIPTFNLKIAPEYKDCGVFKNWGGIK